MASRILLPLESTLSGFGLGILPGCMKQHVGQKFLARQDPMPTGRRSKQRGQLYSRVFVSQQVLLFSDLIFRDSKSF